MQVWKNVGLWPLDSVLKSGTNHYAFFIYHSNVWLLGHWGYKQGQGDGCPVCLQRHRRQQEQYVCWCRYKVFSSFNQHVLRIALYCIFFCNSAMHCGVFFFSGSALAMFFFVSSGWDWWRNTVGASAGSWVPLGPVWSGWRNKQRVGLSAVPFWPAHGRWQIHWLVTHYSVSVCVIQMTPILLL